MHISQCYASCEYFLNGLLTYQQVTNSHIKIFSLSINQSILKFLWCYFPRSVNVHCVEPLLDFRFNPCSTWRIRLGRPWVAVLCWVLKFYKKHCTCYKFHSNEQRASLVNNNCCHKAQSAWKMFLILRSNIKLTKAIIADI